MECRCQFTILVAVSYLLTVNGHVNSSDYSLQFTVYESCMVVLKLHEGCRFVVAFSRCVERSVIKITPKGQTIENLYNITFVQDGSEWDQEESNLDYRDNPQILAYPCACNISGVSIADLYNEWFRQLPHVSWSENFCFFELVRLFRVSNYICRIQYSGSTVNILCQIPVNLPVNLTEVNCVSTWAQLRPCYGYETDISQHQVCLCAFRHNVHNPALKTNGSSREQTFVSSEQARQSAEKTDDIMAEHVHEDKLPAEGHLCDGRPPNPNCTHVLNQRSLERKNCSPSYFGETCKQRCYCKNKIGCHHLSGLCPTDCEIGWKGITCSRRRCPRGLYGVDIKSRSVCTNKCLCGNPDDCDVITGECINGLCLDNTTGTICAEQTCHRRYINKPNCTTKCYCYNDMICNPYNGHCPGNLCQSGYTPPACTSKKIHPLLGSETLLVVIQLLIVAVKLIIAFHFRVIPLFF